MTFDPDALGEAYAAARAAEDIGDLDEAARLFARCMAIDPDDHCGVAMRLARYGLASPRRAPAAYVATLFGQHADAFDDILVGRLGYDVPLLARRLAQPHVAAPARLLDLGCGTGLAGAAFADLAGETVGVDLAEEMLAIADARGVYDDLYLAEAVDFLAEWDEAPFDIVVATDVWPYLGDLAPFATACARAVTAEGLLVASTERADDDPPGGWRVTATQRFAHTSGYLRDVLGAAGFAVLAEAPIVVRHEEGVPVKGDLVVARRSPGEVCTDR